MAGSKVVQALAAAERACQERGVRLTEQRRKVLALIVKAGKPIGAYALLEQLDGFMPAQIYRALDFLLGQKLIHRIESMNAFMACLDSAEPHESQFVICSNCGSTEELHDDAIATSIRRRGRSLGFKIDSQVVEVHGLCAACQAPGHAAAPRLARPGGAGH